jgi:hypothetical protein
MIYLNYIIINYLRMIIIKIIKKTNKSYSTILTNTNKWLNKLDESIYPIIINNIAKNMKSFIEINFKDNINDIMFFRFYNYKYI